jgi:hypothetical protein
MCRGESRKLMTDPVRDEQIASGLFVSGARTGQFGNVCSLSDVMGGRPEEYRFAVYTQRRVSLRYPVDELVCDVVDGTQVRSQPRWGLKVLQKLRSPIGQRPQRRISGVVESVLQEITRRHSARVLVARNVARCPVSPAEGPEPTGEGSCPACFTPASVPVSSGNTSRAM